jgi:hypothetical protein
LRYKVASNHRGRSCRDELRRVLTGPAITSPVISKSANSSLITTVLNAVS